MPLRPITTLLPLLLCVRGGLAQTGSSVAGARGDSLMAAFDTAGAIAAYRTELTYAPDDGVLLGKAALALANLAAETPGREGDEPRLREAADLARHAVLADPRLSRAHTALAVATGRYADHLAHVYRLARAGEVVDLGREAWRSAQRAVVLDPSDYAPYVVIGVWHRELSTLHPMVKVAARGFLRGYPDVSLEESAAFLGHAVRLAPARIGPRFELARTYRAMKRQADARRELETLLALPPRNELERVSQQEARAMLAGLR